MKGISKKLRDCIIKLMAKDDENDAESYRKFHKQSFPEIECDKKPIITSTSTSDTEENHFTTNKPQNGL